MAGKGSRPRKMLIPLEEYHNNLDRIFGTKKKEEEKPAFVSDNPFVCSKCGKDRGKEPCPIDDIALMLKQCPMMPHHQ